jgi:hypothetical protein
MLLSYNKPVTASAGTGAENVIDENVKTWWSGSSGDMLTVDLEDNYEVGAIQVNFGDKKVEADIPEGKGLEVTYNHRYIERTCRPTRWKLEGSTDGIAYFVIYDKSNVKTDLPHDFIMVEANEKIRYVKLTVIETPYSPICVSGIRVFGIGNGKPPKAISDFTVTSDGDLDMDVVWENVNATGYNVLWGFAPEKLYHNCMVFGKCNQRISALIKDEPVFVRIDAFNESGISEGIVKRLGEI